MSTIVQLPVGTIYRAPTGTIGLVLYTAGNYETCNVVVLKNGKFNPKEYFVEDYDFYELEIL